VIFHRSGGPSAPWRAIQRLTRFHSLSPLSYLFRGCGLSFRDSVVVALSSTLSARTSDRLASKAPHAAAITFAAVPRPISILLVSS